MRRKDIARYVAGSGAIAHDAGDGCQPMQVSRLHHGFGPRHGTPEWDAHQKTPQYKIHRIYEQVMFEVRAAELLQKVDEKLSRTITLAPIADGRSAGWEAVKLMKKTLQLLPPEAIVASGDPSQNAPKRGALLFDKVGDKTAEQLLVHPPDCFIRAGAGPELQGPSAQYM